MYRSYFFKELFLLYIAIQTNQYLYCTHRLKLWSLLSIIKRYNKLYFKKRYFDDAIYTNYYSNLVVIDFFTEPALTPSSVAQLSWTVSARDFGAICHSRSDCSYVSMFCLSTEHCQSLLEASSSWECVRIQTQHLPTTPPLNDQSYRNGIKGTVNPLIEPPRL